MQVIALTDWESTAWIATLVAGLAVLLIVLALLEALRRHVVALEGGVEQVLAMGGRLAQNTWPSQLLVTTRARGADLVHIVKSSTTNKGSAL